MTFEEILYKVEKPGRYVGGEYNLPDFGKERRVSFCLCFPDVYEVGMSNLGIQIIYDIINGDKDCAAERCFSPWFDMGKLLKENAMPLMSIETRKPLKDFDVLGFSIQYELSYTNIVYMLDLAGIPYFSKERGNEYPILLAGGPCTANPEPFADFFDIICIGDGEEFIKNFAEIVKEYKGDKKRILSEAKKLKGAYVPSLSETKDGVTVTPVEKTVVKDLDQSSFPCKPLVANLEVVHDRPVVELFRGCYAGCRFCQACFFYRPIRVREEDTVVGISEKLIGSTGAAELGFSSLSSGDYPYIESALERVFGIAKNKNVKLQLPSLRLDSFNSEITKSARKSGLTFAPEAGTQRLRDVINKNITEQDIERTMRSAFEAGYRSVKLYFMVGLPTETDEDLLGIPKTVRRIQEIYYEVCRNRSLNVTVSTSVFVPKSLTPFQWAAQIKIDEMKRRQQLIRSELKKLRGVSYSWHEESASYLEGVFARGERELSALVVNAYRRGAYFDGWSEYYRFERWQLAIADSGIDTDKIVAERDTEDVLPWDFIDFGVKKEYLIEEYRKALQGITQEGCKYGCKGCGANRYAQCKVQKN